MKDIKHAVQVVLFNDKGEVLCVSRKDDHTSFGLPGGKVDPEDNTLEDAAKREVKEETGLDIDHENMIEVFSMYKDGFMGHTYLAQWTGTIDTDEPHVVKWGDFLDLMSGTFGKWNTLVLQSLIGMGVLQPNPPFYKIPQLTVSFDSFLELGAKALWGRDFGKSKFDSVDTDGEVTITIGKSVTAINDSFLKGFFQEDFEKLKTKKLVEEKYKIKSVDPKFEEQISKFFKLMEAIFNSPYYENNKN